MYGSEPLVFFRRSARFAEGADMGYNGMQPGMMGGGNPMMGGMGMGGPMGMMHGGGPMGPGMGMGMQGGGPMMMGPMMGQNGLAMGMIPMGAGGGMGIGESQAAPVSE